MSAHNRWVRSIVRSDSHEIYWCQICEDAGSNLVPWGFLSLRKFYRHIRKYHLRKNNAHMKVQRSRSPLQMLANHIARSR